MAENTVYEYALTPKASPDNTDVIRMVGDGTRSYQVPINSLAAYIAEEYAGTSLGETLQPIKTVIDNLVARVNLLETKIDGEAGGDITVLWTGRVGAKNESITLPESANNYNYFDVYYSFFGQTSILRFSKEQFLTNTGIRVRGTNLSDDITQSGISLAVAELGLKPISDTSFQVHISARWTWNNINANPTQAAGVSPTYNAGFIYQIDGVKNRDLTNIYGQLAALDTRVRALEGN